MGYKQMHGQTFHSKREFLRWIDEHKDEIDWDEDVEYVVITPEMIIGKL